MLLIPSTPQEKKEASIFLLVCVLYAVFLYLFVGLRSDNVFFILLCLGAFFISNQTRTLFYSFFYAAVYAAIYDSMRVFPNYLFNKVRIEAPYLIEKKLFGMVSNGELMTWSEYFQINNTPALDLATGLFYLSWVPVPFAYALYRFVKKDYELVIGFSLTFFTVNFLGWILYYLYPAAPPWYHDLYGNQFIAETIGNPAGLARFDQIVGSPFFENMYTKSSSVFGAIPSLHAAFPLILTHFSLKRKNPLLTLFFIITLLGIWFSAIYTNHHYILDVVLGIICGIMAILIYEKVWNKSLRRIMIEPFLNKVKTL